MEATTERAAFTPEEIAKRASVGRTTVYLEMKAGRLRSLKVGKLRRITPAMEREWLEKLAAASAA